MLSVGMWTWPLYSSLEIVKMKESTASGGGEDAGSAYENACEALTLGFSFQISKTQYTKVMVITCQSFECTCYCYLGLLGERIMQ